MVLDVQLFNGQAAPFHRDLFRSALIAFEDEHLDKFGLVELRRDNDFLSLFDIYTGRCNKLCVFFKS